jgi:hypothetical protein
MLNKEIEKLNEDKEDLEGHIEDWKARVKGLSDKIPAFERKARAPLLAEIKVKDLIIERL